MRRVEKASTEKVGAVVALTLTWDGARWPQRTLPAGARKFLAKGHAKKKAGAAELTQLLADDRVKELRICWVPRLLGGEETFCLPLETASDLRIGFRATTWRHFGDVLGVVYRRFSKL